MTAAEPSRTPSSELRARVLAEIAQTPADTRAQHRRRILVASSGATVATAILFLAMGGFRWGTRPMPLVVFSSGLGLLAAAVLMHVALGGRSMLGRPRSALVTAFIVTAGVLALAALVAPLLWPSPEGVMTAHLACAIETVVQGALPLLALLVARRSSDPVKPALTGATFGMSAGAWAVMLAYLRCPEPGAAHCIVAHVAPTLILTALGAVLGRALLRIR
jgi:hypothetical protein